MNALLQPTLWRRAMALRDLNAVMAIEVTAYSHPWTRGNFADSLDSGYSAWVMREEGALAAYALMMQVVDEVQLLNLSVAPTRQRSGLGSSLLAHLRAQAAGAGGLRLFLEVRASNAAAQAFYSRHGFHRIGERRDYYPAACGRELALVLELKL